MYREVKHKKMTDAEAQSLISDNQIEIIEDRVIWDRVNENYVISKFFVYEDKRYWMARSINSKNNETHIYWTTNVNAPQILNFVKRDSGFPIPDGSCRGLVFRADIESKLNIAHSDLESPPLDHFITDVSFEVYMKMLKLYPLHKAEDYFKKGDYKGLKQFMNSYVNIIQNGFGKVPKSRVTVSSISELENLDKNMQEQIDKHREDYSKGTPLSMWFRLD